MEAETPTTAELKAAFERARQMRFDGFSFERAMAVPSIRTVMSLSAIAHRRVQRQAEQPRLI